MTELRVLAGGAIAASMRAIAPHFEGATGHRPEFFFGTTPELIEEATSGRAFDAGVTPHEVFSNAAARARFATPTPIDIAHVGLGVAVRQGATKPDISTLDAMRTTLLDAASIATIPGSAAGMQITRMFEHLGITEAMAPKIRVKKAPPDVVQAVASGETELGMFLENVFQSPDIEVLTPFAEELQRKVVFAVATAAETPHVAAAEDLIAYLRSPEAAAIIKQQGMTPC